jgi:hypothetical protein
MTKSISNHAGVALRQPVHSLHASGRVGARLAARRRDMLEDVSMQLLLVAACSVIDERVLVLEPVCRRGRASAAALPRWLSLRTSHAWSFGVLVVERLQEACWHLPHRR